MFGYVFHIHFVYLGWGSFYYNLLVRFLHAVEGFEQVVVIAQDLAFAALSKGELPSFLEAVGCSRGRLLVNVVAAFKDLAYLHIMPEFDLIFHVILLGWLVWLYYTMPLPTLHDLVVLPG